MVWTQGHHCSDLDYELFRLKYHRGTAAALCQDVSMSNEDEIKLYQLNLLHLGCRDEILKTLSTMVSGFE